MNYRLFGNTGLRVSELGFGAWAIGGRSFGAVAPDDALRALHRAEELGCNFVDTAAVYGDSEAVLGRFLRGRREQWIVASKYSWQSAGMTALVEQQLDRLGTDRIDFYQLHAPAGPGKESIYDELDALKRAGKIRYAGVSLYSESDLDDVLTRTCLDGVQIKFGLLDPRPLLDRLALIRERGAGVIVRSCLRDGFLSGKYSATSTFTDPEDQRSKWPADEIARIARAAERFRFLEAETGAMTHGAIRYALSFPGVSTVILSTKNEQQASANFGPAAQGPLPPATLEQIRRVQHELGLFSDSLVTRLRRLARNIRNSLKH